ncbi:VCBS repeat-containing protein [Planctomycetota bacterium]
MKLAGIFQLALMLVVNSAIYGMEEAKAPKSVHDIAITNISAPSDCNQGETVPITVNLANQGIRRETFAVRLANQNSGKEIASKEMALAKGWKDGSEDVADVIFDAETDEVNQMGGRVCAEGDANGDGYNDLIITASEWNGTQGRAYLYLGEPNVRPSPHRVFTGESVGDHYGDVGATFGDVNNDGYDDIIICARGYHDNDGLVHVYNGGKDISTVPDLTLMGEADQKSWFGLIVSSGDVNNDGYEDVLVTALGYDNWRGRAYLYYGGNPMDTTADLILEGENTGDWFGRSACIGGDVNGDGYNDLMIGASPHFSQPH